LTVNWNKRKKNFVILELCIKPETNQQNPDIDRREIARLCVAAIGTPMLIASAIV
jgi:hypothetical protein